MKKLKSLIDFFELEKKHSGFLNKIRYALVIDLLENVEKLNAHNSSVDSGIDLYYYLNDYENLRNLLFKRVKNLPESKTKKDFFLNWKLIELTELELTDRIFWQIRTIHGVYAMQNSRDTYRIELMNEANVYLQQMRMTMHKQDIIYKENLHKYLHIAPQIACVLDRNDMWFINLCIDFFKN